MWQVARCRPAGGSSLRPAVSGYRVLPRWLAGREGLRIEATFIPEFRDVAARIAELIDLFAAADSLLERTLDQPLSRAALGFDVEVASGDERDD